MCLIHQGVQGSLLVFELTACHSFTPIVRKPVIAFRAPTPKVTKFGGVCSVLEGPALLPNPSGENWEIQENPEHNSLL